jgi:hypothetical protein
MVNRHRYFRYLLRDLFIVTASIFAAVALANNGFIHSFVEATESSRAFSSFVSGAFFTSIFTLAPASVALVAISQSFPPISVAFFGALGAAFIDIIIISFVRKDLARDLDNVARMTFRHHIIKAFHFGFLKWAAFIIGLLLIATPLPDEPGLLMIGLSRVNTFFLPLIFFISHFFGIWALISIAAAI